MIPLVERMDYLAAQSNSLAYALSVEKLLGLEMPERVRNIRVLIAELQRIASHLIWLGTHAMEIGAVSMLFYAIRERELLLNINELIAGFRFFPSYIRIGGLREDLPRGFHEAVNAFLDRFPTKLDEFEGLLSKNDIFMRRTQGVGVLTQEDALAWGLLGPIARATGSDYDVRKYFPVPGYDTYDFDVPIATEGDVYARYRVRMREMRESVKICRQAIERIPPSGAWACEDPRVVPPPKDKVYTEMEALIQHFLIYSQGFTVPAGDVYVPVEGPRGEHGVYACPTGRTGRGASRCARLRSWRSRRCRPSSRAASSPTWLPSSAPTMSSWETATGELSSPDGVHAGAVPRVGAHAARRGRRVRLHTREPGEVRRERAAVSARSAEVGHPLRAVSRAGAAGLSDRRGDAVRRRSRSGARRPKSKTSSRTTRCSSRNRSASTC